MLTANRPFRLAGRDFTPGEEIPEALWLSDAVPERNRRAMVDTRFVVDPALKPTKALLRARRQGLTAPVAAPAAPAAPVSFACPLATCGKSFASKSALGGHMRGHAKRGEA